MSLNKMCYSFSVHCDVHILGRSMVFIQPKASKKRKKESPVEVRHLPKHKSTNDFGIPVIGGDLC